jgi:two-component system nitrogen regulation response regulator GlnG
MKRSARALDQKRRAAAAVVTAPRDLGDDLPLVGRTASMQALYRLVAKVMNTDLPVLITGESGTGKSLIARAIHDFSDRRSQPFVVVQSGDLAGVEGISALLAKAKGGSLLIDEVADFDEDGQSRLVRMLDIADDHAPRILATSQADLAQRVEEGRLRKDLFYRLGGVTLAVPPLRERVEDISLLADHFLTRGEREIGTTRRLSNEARNVLRVHPWPGNVRQLENVLKRLLVTSSEPEILQPELDAALGGSHSAEPAQAGQVENEKLSASVARHLKRYFDLHNGQLPPAGVYDRILREIETPLIEIALDATAGNQAKCADLLGINRNTLRKKITDLDIRVTRRRKLM